MGPVNHACPPRLPFTLDVELGWETIFHSDLGTLVLHTLGRTSLLTKGFLLPPWLHSITKDRQGIFAWRDTLFRT